MLDFPDRPYMFECGDASAARVAPAPQIVDFHRAFERNREAHFLWFLSFGKTKERNSPSGEIFAIGASPSAKAKMT
jgi:hypothetical protein